MCKESKIFCSLKYYIGTNRIILSLFELLSGDTLFNSLSGKKQMFNPQKSYNNQPLNPVQENVKFWLKINIGKLRVKLMGFKLPTPCSQSNYAEFLKRW